MSRFVLPVLLLFVLGACGTKDNVAPPAELKTITTELKTSRLWHQDTGAGSAKHFLRLRAYLEDNRIYVVDTKGKVTALNKDNGDELWSRSIKEPVSAGVNGGEGIIVIGSLEGKVTALATEDGQQSWQISLSSEVMNLSRVSSGRLVARTNDGHLYGIDASNGETVWQFKYTVPALSLSGMRCPSF